MSQMFSSIPNAFPLDLTTKESQPKTKDLSKEIERVKADVSGPSDVLNSSHTHCIRQNDITLKALLSFRGDSDSKAIVPLSAEEIKKIDDEFTKWRKEWVNRKKVYKEYVSFDLSQC